MSTATLEALAPELFDIVVQDLHLDDIRQLRLASKETCFKATQDRFLSFAARKRVELTRTGLDTFARMTSQGCLLGCAVQHLTLIGVSYDLSILEEILKTGKLGWLPSRGPRRPGLVRLSEEQMGTARSSFDELNCCQENDKDFHESGKSLELLSQAMRDISSHTKHGLDILSLEVAISDGGPVVEHSPIHKSPARSTKQRRELIFRTAAETFGLVSLALRDNGPYIRHFGVFGGISGPLPCRLPFSAFKQIKLREPQHHWPSFRTLESLSQWVSDRELNPACISSESSSSADSASWWDSMLGQELETDGCHIAHLVQMQSLCSQLEELRIIWYRIMPEENLLRLSHPLNMGRQARKRVQSGDMWQHTFGEPQWRARQRYMHELARCPPFSHLRKFHLGGLSVHTSDLFGFVEKHQQVLREIYLDNIQAVHSTFEQLFSLLARPDTKMQHIHLEDLQENLAAVYFGIEQRSEYTKIFGNQWDNNIIERWGEDTKKQIMYSTRKVRLLGTVANGRAARRSNVEFGSIAAGMPDSDIAAVNWVNGTEEDSE